MNKMAFDGWANRETWALWKWLIGDRATFEAAQVVASCDWDSVMMTREKKQGCKNWIEDVICSKYRMEAAGDISSLRLPFCEKIDWKEIWVALRADRIGGIR